MDFKRSSDQLRSCVAYLLEYFASAASPARRCRFISRKDAANALGDLIRELNGQEAAWAQHKDVLLSLTTGLDEVTAATAALGQPSLGTPPPGQHVRDFIGSWLSLLCAAALVAYNLLQFVSPYLSEAEQERLVASVTACTDAICTACSRLVQLRREQQSVLDSEAAGRDLLGITNECLRLAFHGILAGLRAVAPAGSAGADPAALAQAAALLAQLRPERVLGWLRCALDAVDWVVSTAGMEKSTCLAPLLGILDHATPLPLGLGQALCNEPDLLSRLARLTARPPAGADADQAELLAVCWLTSISMIGQCLSLQCIKASQELSRSRSPARLRSLLLLVAASAQHVLRFVSAAAAGGPAAEGISRVESPPTAEEALQVWAESCWVICFDCMLCGPADSPQQQHETASTVAGLLDMLLQLLARLPRLAEASGEPLSTGCFLMASMEASILLAHWSVPPPGLAPLSASLVALHTNACRAAHALLSCSDSALSLAGIGPLPGQVGKLHTDAAAWLTDTLLTTSKALLAALLQSGPADGDEEAAAKLDRAYTRCLLELTAAVSELQPYTLGCKLRRRVKCPRPNAARQRALAVLQQLTTPRFARQCGLGIAGGTSSQPSQQAVLAALAGRLSSQASRELLSPLLERLLPPAEAPRQEAAPSPVPPAAAVLQAQALAQRQCAYLLCGSIEGCGEGEPAPRGKRCSGCCQVRYCSRACQVADWPAHKAACRALAVAADGGSAEQ
ncbi:hypothetical protein ABPG77_011078 [Micractinium sp. CCAP 211/92]